VSQCVSRGPSDLWGPFRSYEASALSELLFDDVERRFEIPDALVDLLMHAGDAGLLVLRGSIRLSRRREQGQPNCQLQCASKSTKRCRRLSRSRAGGSRAI
jgi:hypothetical protein